jgi:hypothetical protein
VFDIINPLAPYTIRSDEDEAACAINILYLFDGPYGLEDAVSGDVVMRAPLCTFDVDDWWAERFGRTFDDYMDKASSKAVILRALRSVMIGDTSDRGVYESAVNEVPVALRPYSPEVLDFWTRKTGDQQHDWARLLRERPALVDLVDRIRNNADQLGREAVRWAYRLEPDRGHWMAGHWLGGPCTEDQWRTSMGLAPLAAEHVPGGQMEFAPTSD